MSANGYTLASRLPPTLEVAPRPAAAPAPADGKPELPADTAETSTRLAPGTAERLAERPAARPADRERLNQVKGQVQRWLVDVINPGAELESGGAQVRGMIDGYLDQVLAQEGMVLARADRTRLFEGIVAELLALGPIEPLLHDESITEVMVNGPDQVWVERRGIIEETDVRFENDDHVRRIIDRIVSPLGRRCDEGSPMVDARLPDGSRVNAIIPPLSLIGPTLTIRKFARDLVSINDLIHLGTLTHEV